MATSGSPSPRETFQATIETFLYRSDTGEFGVARARKEPGATSVILVGDLTRVSEGETLRLQGWWQTHPVHGRRFRIESFSPVTPSTPDGIARYLGSGLVPGVGSALAARLVDRFGARTLDVIATQSGRLREVAGIGPQRARAIAEAVRVRRDEAEALSYLHELGLGQRLARRIFKHYGAQTVSMVRDNPYRLVETIPGVGFRTADRVGLAGNFSMDDPRRVEGAVLHFLGEAIDAGHVYLPADAMVRQAATLQLPPSTALEGLQRLASRGQLVLDEHCIYAPAMLQAERRVAATVARLVRMRPSSVDTARAVQVLNELKLNAEQEEVIRASLQRGLVILTGGPGTGKTTTVRALLACHEAAGRRVTLCAPTGRAAKRLSEATGRDAKTLHRLLELNPATHRSARDRSTPLVSDLVLVDEASMLDLRLADALLEALQEGTQLLLVGDTDQLPPVGAGQVLRELLVSQRVPVVRLVKIFRQAQRSDIVRAAHCVLAGELPTATAPGHRSDGDLFIVRAQRPDTIQKRLIETLERIPKAYGLHPRDDVRVLAPMRRGPIGTEQLNQLLQRHFHPQMPVGPDRGLRPGDKVMQLRNDYEREVFNGDLGIVQRVESGVVFAEMAGREVAFDHDALESLTLAYASTVHKVQGSEFPCVIVVLHSAHHMLLSRALLYTAITRAQRLVVILGEARALQRATRNAVSYQSYARLSERLQTALKASTAS